MTFWLIGFIGISLTGYLVLSSPLFARRENARPWVLASLLSVQSLLWLWLPRLTGWSFPGWEGLQLTWTLPAWGVGLAVSLALSGAAWHDLAHPRPDPTGALQLLAFPLLGLALISASSRSLLLFWAALDLLWLVSAIRAEFSASRLSTGVMTRGLSLLLLWGSNLPGLTTNSLLPGLAALLRLAPYPFTFERRSTTPLWLSFIQPILAAQLLAQIASPLPWGMALWTGLAALLTAVRALLGQEEERRSRTGEALLLATFSAGFAQPGTPLPLIAVGAWSAGRTLFELAYGWQSSAWLWLLPGLWGLAVMLGLPPAPIGFALWSALAHSAWPVLALLFLTLPLALTAGARELKRPLSAVPLAATRPHQAAQAAGLLLLMMGTIVGSAAGLPALETLGLGVWAIALLAGGALAFWGTHLQPGPRWERLTDPAPTGHLLEQGAGRLLQVINILAGVIEGDGALIWSLVFLLLILLAGRIR